MSLYQLQSLMQKLPKLTLVYGIMFKTFIKIMFVFLIVRNNNPAQIFALLLFLVKCIGYVDLSCQCRIFVFSLLPIFLSLFLFFFSSFFKSSGYLEQEAKAYFFVFLAICLKKPCIYNLVLKNQNYKKRSLVLDLVMCFFRDAQREYMKLSSKVT